MNNILDDVAAKLVAIADAPKAYAGGDYRYAVRVTGGEKWPSGLASSGLGSSIHHSIARRNARVALQDSIQARSVVTRTADTVADGGLRLELAPNYEMLGISREAAAKWARINEARFHLWARTPLCHRAGQMNFYQMQCFWQFTRHRDNDNFLRFYYEDKDPTLLNPLQLEFLDPDQIRGDAFTNIYGFNQTTTNGFQNLQDGISRDERGRETAYKVWVRQADGTYLDKTIPAVYPGGRRSMIHGFTAEYAGQGRGYTRLAHAIQEFENITDFSSATIKKAINQSCIVGFVEPSKAEDAVNPFEGILTDKGAGPAGKLIAASAAEVTNQQQPSATAGIEATYQVPEATLDTPGSMFIANLTKGSSIKFPANTAPGDSFGDFVGEFAGYIAASLNIPLEVVLMKFGQNYSASRATLLLFWDVVKYERGIMAYQMLDPVVEMWMSGEIAAGRIQAPGWSDPVLRAAWLTCGWIGGGAPDIDPVKSAKARRENIELGLTNAERESRDLNGTSAADNIAKNNAAYGEYKPLPWNEPGNPPPGTKPDEPTDPEEKG